MNVCVKVKADFEQEDVIGSSENDDCDRGSWGNPLEFLMSCIAMSVGLGKSSVSSSECIG